MKLHLPHSLFRALIACFALSVSLTATSFAERVDSITYTTHQDGALNVIDHSAVIFENIRYVRRGAAISQDGENTTILSLNDSVLFSENMATSDLYYSHTYRAYGGAIYNLGSLTLRDNGDVTFRANTTTTLYPSSNCSYEYYGGAIYNGGAFVMSGNNGASFVLSGNGDVTFSENKIASGRSHGGAIYNEGTFSLSDNGNVTFSKNSASYGGAIYSWGKFFSLSGNESVSFSGNKASSSDAGVIENAGGFALSDNGRVIFSGNTGSVIRNTETFMLNGNEDVIFRGNTAAGIINKWEYSDFTLSDNGAVTFTENGGSAIGNAGTFMFKGNGEVSFNENKGGGVGNSGTLTLRDNEAVAFIKNKSHAIANSGSLSLSDNGNVTFSENTASDGGAIFNSRDADFTLSDNDNVTFIGNSAVLAGAIRNDGTFTLSRNGEVTFRSNRVPSPSSFTTGTLIGGAILNYGTFTLSGNEDVLFEKNVEVNKGSYRLRSIYSGSGSLNLSASIGRSITFRDSVYTSGTVVNLNQNGAGDIIFTGATTEVDLCEVKGGIDGTAQEILNSRTSEIATNATLYGGRLIVENGAILMGQGITVTEGANATIRLKDATLDETGYAIAVSSGSGLEFEGENTLTAASVSMADNSTIRFVLNDNLSSLVNMDACLYTGKLSIELYGDLSRDHQLLALNDALQYDVSAWTRENVSVSGATYDDLIWKDGVLTYYSPYFVIAPNHDRVLDDSELLENDKVFIEGGSHSLTVKNEVQLVQMALKDGIVKLEGENNGIVSVTLTEGGELVLTAGAGLKTGDIISMVASGKGELVISGDITIDNKGMKGKKGELASVSHADAKVLGDASISNVRVEDSVIDLAEGSTVGFEHVVLAATTRITDDPATANLDDVTAELVMGVNTSLTGSDMLLAGTSLEQSGNPGVTLTLSDDASVLLLESTTFDSLTLSGSSLVLELAGMTLEMFDNAELIAVSFTSGKDYATFDKSLAVTLSVDGINYERGYTMESDDTPTTMYFRGGKKPAATPEPATATLSLLAMAALAARRRRR